MCHRSDKCPKRCLETRTSTCLVFNVTLAITIKKQEEIEKRKVKKFKSVAWILFELFSGQNSSMKINKDQLLQKYDAQSNGSCALHFSSIRSICPQNFKSVAGILFELCSKQY